MFIIINWSSRADIAVILDDDGKPMVFESAYDAFSYAESELKFMWEIVEL